MSDDVAMDTEEDHLKFSVVAETITDTIATYVLQNHIKEKRGKLVMSGHHGGEVGTDVNVVTMAVKLGLMVTMAVKLGLMSTRQT